jgi:hypothetical protein
MYNVHDVGNFAFNEADVAEDKEADVAEDKEADVAEDKEA